MIIETMKIADYDQLHELWNHSDGVTLRAVDDSREGFERFLKRNPELCFVCRGDSGIVGAVLCGHDGRKGFLYHAFVHKEYRRTGIGKKLVLSAVEALKKEHITKVAVLINADNDSGNRFWESLGFSFDRDLIYRLLPLDALNT